MGGHPIRHYSWAVGPHIQSTLGGTQCATWLARTAPHPVSKRPNSLRYRGLFERPAVGIPRALSRLRFVI